MLGSHRRTGFTLIELLVVIAIIGILLGLTAAGVQRVRGAAARADCANRLRQIALACQQHHDTQRSLPAGVTYDDGKHPQPFMSWSVRILPFLEHDEMWRQSVQAFAANKNFQAVPPHTGYETPMRVFACPSDHRVLEKPTPGWGARTSYLGVAGTEALSRWNGVIYVDSRVRFADVRDGLSNTLMVGERPPSSDLRLGWWYGGWGQMKTASGDCVLGVRELVFYYPECPKGPYQYVPGSINEFCDSFHFWSLHPGGANFAFCDGTVRYLAYSANAIMPALATREGGETTTLPY
jgi:prepilin-type N-terminal cleavage/methylation domain-containing protein/prepilin-type processing-associated H-X9-DG protein